MSLLSKLKNYWNWLPENYSKDYVILLTDYDMEDGRLYTNKIFRELKNSGIAIIASNEGSYNWHFLINFQQNDNTDQSEKVKNIMKPVLEQFHLNIKKVWPDKSDH